MKKIFLFVFIFLSVAVSAQRDKWSKSVSVADITGSDSLYYPTYKGGDNIANCLFKDVRIEIVVNNTLATDATISVGGFNSDINYDLSDVLYNYLSSTFPVTIDTTATAWVVSEGGTYYKRTFYMQDFPYDEPAFKVTNNTETQADIKFYITIDK